MVDIEPFSLEKAMEEIDAIRTTGLAGGLFCPYKGLLPAALSCSEFLPLATIPQLALKRLFLYFI